jgi:nicotinamidase-related amidase
LHASTLGYFTIRATEVNRKSEGLEIIANVNRAMERAIFPGIRGIFVDATPSQNDSEKSWRRICKHVLNRWGRFTLVQTEEGFEWELMTLRGGHWYWDPATQSWTGACRPSPTPEAATLGLSETLAQEDGQAKKE